MYKDPDKQREANRLQMRRARAKGNTKQDSVNGNTVCPRVTDQEFTRLLAVDAGRTIIKVSKPGVPDYFPQCETTKAFVEGRPKDASRAKRGKDIKCFADLPLDVQATIRRLSDTNEEFEKRTAIAIRYQHLFPDRYHSTGAAI